VKFYELDNEVTLWSEQHFDIHSNDVSYDELWNLTLTYGAAVKQTDPNVFTFGPVPWGWCAYFWSAVDNCGETPTDREAHGNTPFLEWWAAKVYAYYQTTGVKLVDYLDVHYYPQNGEALSSDESNGLDATRLRSIKSLYDPNYKDESWIDDYIMLIPRMQDIIARNCPFLKLAITEYNWGNDDILTGALAQAEILAIFGKYGLDVGSRWVVPAVGSLVEQSYKMYLNYDGNGNTVQGDSVQCTSTDVDEVGAYAIHDQNKGELYVYLFNKYTSSLSTAVNVVQGISSSVQLYQFSSGQNYGSIGSVSASSPNAFVVNLPARSATLAIVQVSTSQTFPSQQTIASATGNSGGVTAQPTQNTGQLTGGQTQNSGGETQNSGGQTGQNTGQKSGTQANYESTTGYENPEMSSGYRLLPTFAFALLLLVCLL